MHQPIRERVEEYLGGTADAGSLREIEDHLGSCESCRRAVAQMRQQSQLLKVLRPPAGVEPAAGFYARVREQIESQYRASVWSAFLEPAFAKRIAYASLTLLLLLATVMISVDREQAPSPSSLEVILAEESPEPPFGIDQQRDRDTVLVNLATYQEY